MESTKVNILHFCFCTKIVLLVDLLFVFVVNLPFWILKKKQMPRKSYTKMYTWILIKILPLLILIIDLKCALSIPRIRYRTYRSKGPPPFPSILQYSPPRQTSAPNFQNDYVTPPFLMNSPPKSSYDQPPNSSYDQLPVMDYDSPNNGIQMEYGPPTTADSKPLVHKHIYVHIPPPEPDTPVMRYILQFRFVGHFLILSTIVWIL